MSDIVHRIGRFCVHDKGPTETKWVSRIEPHDWGFPNWVDKECSVCHVRGHTKTTHEQYAEARQRFDDSAVGSHIPKHHDINIVWCDYRGGRRAYLKWEEERTIDTKMWRFRVTSPLQRRGEGVSTRCFSTLEAATAHAERLHEDFERFYHWEVMQE